MSAVGGGGRWDEVAAWLNREMERQQMSASKLAAAANMDMRTLNRLLRGEGVLRADRRAAVALALGFEGDAISRILAGEEPPTRAAASDGGDELRFRSIERRLDRLEALIEDALQPPDPPEDAR